MSALLLALACASCGSGGDSPLILYPNEPYKVYAAAAFQAGFKTVTANGEARDDIGPAQRDTVTIAGGTTFLTDWFATLTVPYVTNARDGERRSGTGDPLLSLTWTVLPASILAPVQPQVQVTVAYKRSVSRSIYNADDPHLLDVYGTGFDEARAGVDLWWGASAWKAGCAAVALWPRERVYEGQELSPGKGVRATVTGGYGFYSAGKLIAGAVVERHGRRTSDGQAMPDSEEASNNIFVGGDAMINETQSVRVTLTRAAAFGRNQNATAVNGVTLAWMGAL